jgi:N-acetylmuramoyl-L-alanine amidase
VKRTLLLGAVLLAAPFGAAAQTNDLGLVIGGRTARVPGLARGGTTYYPIWALDQLGAETVADARGAQTVMFGDTLTFLALSPFFTADRSSHNLAFPVIRHTGVVHLPEQFFIEWLPRHYGTRIEYRGGALRTRRAIQAAASETIAATSAPAARVVVIDAGHGGLDPGRIGPGGVREKDVTLRIAERLAAALRERNYEVHLTRSRDTLIALDDRPRIANQLRRGRAAVFLSIHANAVEARSVRGFETFFLSEARTEDEKRVAEMENAAVRFEDDPVDQTEIDLILNGLRNDFYVNASNDLAEVVQAGMATVHDGPDRGVKRAGFRVLVGALMPAVLVEVAFLSNPEEARRLNDAGFQRDIANGIADAVDRFFATHRYMSEMGTS